MLTAMLCLPGLAPAINQENIVELQPFGVFFGEVFSSGTQQNAETTFRIEPGIGLVGDYLIEEPTGIISGRLHNFVTLSANTMQCTWLDEYGSGTLIMTF